MYCWNPQGKHKTQSKLGKVDKSELGETSSGLRYCREKFKAIFTPDLTGTGSELNQTQLVLFAWNHSATGLELIQNWTYFFAGPVLDLSSFRTSFVL